MKYATRLSTDALRHLKHSHQLRAMMKRRERIGSSAPFSPCTRTATTLKAREVAR